MSVTVGFNSDSLDGEKYLGAPKASTTGFNHNARGRPNEVTDLATLNLTMMQYWITRCVMMSFQKIGVHYSQIIINSFCLLSQLFQHNLQRPTHKAILCPNVTLDRLQLTSSPGLRVWHNPIAHVSVCTQILHITPTQMELLLWWRGLCLCGCVDNIIELY